MVCTVIDDEPFALDLIKGYILKTPFLTLAGSFSNPFKALSFLTREPVDLIFLDINMPELSGIQLLKSLPHPPMVVFTTAYPEFAAESYEYNAVDYLLKPIKYERFLKAVNKASELMHPQPVSIASAPTEPPKSKELLIKSGTQLLKVHPEDILYVEGAGNYMTFHTKVRKFLSLLTMSEVLDLLPDDQFLRIHKSFVVSLNKITAIEKHDVIIDGKRIPVGITYREAVMGRLM